MANNTKHIEGGGKSGKKGFKKHLETLPKKPSSRDSSMKKFPQLQAKKAQRAKKRGYVSSYLDLTVNTPGKYGVDY